MGKREGRCKGGRKEEKKWETRKERKRRKKWRRMYGLRVTLPQEGGEK